MEVVINTDAAHGYAKKLIEMRKSAFPTAIRNTLNSVAFDVKTKTMPVEVKKFINRQENFFRANSKVERAMGLDINTMSSKVGFVSTNLKLGANNYAVKDLEEQESGGSIGGKSFIPIDEFARSGANNRGLVKPNARLSRIKNMVDAKAMPGKSNRQKFIQAAATVGQGGFVLYENKVWRIDSRVVSNLKTRKVQFKSNPIYTFKRGRTIRVKSTHFMKTASFQSARKMESFFMQYAKRELERLK